MRFCGAHMCVCMFCRGADERLVLRLASDAVVSWRRSCGSREIAVTCLLVRESCNSVLNIGGVVVLYGY